jgi:hypothetical protein
MKLSKAQREVVKQRFGGRCAYCGVALGDRWHADHQEPVTRITQWVDGVGFKPTGEMHSPHRDTIENLFPACPPCNIDKGGFYLEDWRERLTKTTATLMRDAPAYRHAKRFGLVAETGAPVVFYFERIDVIAAE